MLFITYKLVRAVRVGGTLNGSSYALVRPYRVNLIKVASLFSPSLSFINHPEVIRQLDTSGRIAYRREVQVIRALLKHNNRVKYYYKSHIRLKEF